MCKRLDLTGQTFGRLTVIKRIEDRVYQNGCKYVQWQCVCNCTGENIKNATTLQLRSGNVKSCGCLQTESRFLQKKKNDFVFHDGYVTMFTSGGYPFFVDVIDFKRVYEHCWNRDDKGYIFTRINGKTQKLHRFIMGNPKGKLVDHKYGTATIHDNRRYNLRVATDSENNMNREIPSNNTSGVVGVSWNKNAQKWTAQIKINGKKIHLGTFADKDEAIRIRREAEDKYFGDFGYRKSRDVDELKE